MWKAVSTLLEAITLVQVLGTGQADVIIKVKDKSAYNFRTITFPRSFFQGFHECLCTGQNNCSVTYSLSDSTVNGRTPDHGQQNEMLASKYYACATSSNNNLFTCLQQLHPPTGDHTQTYRLLNSVCSSTCVGFVWKHQDEYITFPADDQLDVEVCDAKCFCPVQTTGSTTRTMPSPTTVSTTATTTTATATTTKTTTTATITTTTATPTTITTSTTTGQSTSSIKASTKLTTTLSTANFTSPSKESALGSENSGEDAPIGIIVGAVVGVIAVIVIIIIIVVIWKRRAGAKSSDNAGYETSATSSNGAGVNGKINDVKSHSYYNAEFSENSSESHSLNNDVLQTNAYQNSLHQPNITKNGVTPVKDAPKPQFTIKDNDSDFGYSTAQLVVPEDNNRNVNGKKPRDDYDYVSAEDHVGVSDPTPKTTRDKTPFPSLPKVRDDYAVVDKTRKNKNASSTHTNTGLMSDYEDIPEEDYGYSHAEGDASAQGTNDAAVGKAHVNFPKGNLAGTSDLNQDFGYEYSRTSDGYTTVGNVNQSDPDPNNDDPNATNVYSRLHDPVRDIQNPYNVGPNTNDVYSRLHEEVRDIKNPYNVLPEAQGTSDSHNGLPDTVHNAQDTKKQKLSKGLPYGPQDYAVVVKTKSNKPAQSTFELENDDN